MKKIILIILIGIFLSSGALMYQDGNLTLNIDSAKKSLTNTFVSVVKTIEGYK